MVNPNAYLVGTSEPTASLILNQRTKRWKMLLDLNQCFPSVRQDRSYKYTIFVPTCVGPDINLVYSMSNAGQQYVYGFQQGGTATGANAPGREEIFIVKEIGGDFTAETDIKLMNARLELDVSDTTRPMNGHFTKFTLYLYIADEQPEARNIHLSISAPLFVECSALTDGVDRFPIKIVLTEVSGSVLLAAPGDGDGVLPDTHNDEFLENGVTGTGWSGGTAAPGTTGGPGGIIGETGNIEPTECSV